MTLKRKSTEMDLANWIALENVAADCDCFYSGKPSWRRLLTLIARGVLVVTVQDKSGLYRRRTRYKDPRERAERDRLRQQRIRRAAGITPHSTPPPSAPNQDGVSGVDLMR
ncbi:MAG: hypothetical protein ACYDH9_12580 [Limisphaerales bacterium]